jgi:AcrR family transcriptional regulator
MSEPLNAEPTTNHGLTADARAHITDIAASAFAKRGYHGASVEEICAEASVDRPIFDALFADKYELFREVALATTFALLRATDGLEGTDPRQARTTLARVIEQSVTVTIATRATGGFYRSEYRYLTRPDAEMLSEQIGELRRRIREPLMLHRPELTEFDANLLAAAAQSIIASITIHETSLPAPKLQTLLTVTAMRLLDSEPATSDPHNWVATIPKWQGDTSEAGRILAAAVDLYYQRGFQAVTLDDVAASAGIPRDAVDRHYATASDLLSTACLRGYESLESDTQRAIASTGSPGDRLGALTCAYVRHYFADHKVMSIYLADARSLDDRNRRSMLALQEESVQRWTNAIMDARPELSSVEAVFLAFAALSLVSDLGRLVRWNDDEVIKAKIERCTRTVMALVR